MLWLVACSRTGAWDLIISLLKQYALFGKWVSENFYSISYKYMVP